MVLDYKDLVLESLYENDVIDEDLYLKCQPKYIQSLPGNLRSNDIDLLNERNRVITQELRNRADTIAGEESVIASREREINNAMKENDELQKNLDNYEKAADKLFEESTKSQNEALNEAQDIRDHWNDLGTPNNEVTDDIPVDVMKDALNNFGSMEFLNKGYLTSAEANYMRNLARNLEIYAMGDEYDGGPYSNMSEELQASAFMIEEFADKYDINKNPIGDTFQEVMGYASQASDWRSAIANNDALIERNNELIEESNKLIEKLERESAVLLENNDKTMARINALRS